MRLQWCRTRCRSWCRGSCCRRSRRTWGSWSRTHRRRSPTTRSRRSSRAWSPSRSRLATLVCSCECYFKLPHTTILASKCCTAIGCLVGLDCQFVLFCPFDSPLYVVDALMVLVVCDIICESCACNVLKFLLMLVKGSNNNSSYHLNASNCYFCMVTS